LVINKVTNINFSDYGIEFQEKIIQALLTDRKWAEQMTEVLNIRYFEKNYLLYLAKKYFEYYEKYRALPTIGLLIGIIKTDLKDGNDEILKRQIVSFIHRIRTKPDIEDLPYVKDKALDFCKRQALKEALEKSVDLIETEKYESVVEVIKKAVSAGVESSIGMNFFDDLEQRFVLTNRKVIPTGMVELDAKDAVLLVVNCAW